MKRRHLLASSALLTGSTLSSSAQDRTKKTSLKKGDVILFQGDSITDAGRDKKNQDKPNDQGSLGRGYPLYIGSDLLGAHPSLDLQIFNRGISGHKVPQLEARWKKDTLDLKPAVLSILIGVNDMWHKMNGKYDGTVEDYRDGFDALIKDTQRKLKKTTIVICEPFALKCGAVKDSWFPEFDERRAAAKEVAEKNNALWVPFQTMFDDAIAAGTRPQHWARDGVHPTFSGHSLMAQTWRKVVGI